LESSDILGSIAPGGPPQISGLFDRIRDRLGARGRLGLVSLTVLSRRPGSVEPTSWQAYDECLGHVAEFLGTIRGGGLRADDRIFGPSSSGNSFVLVLEPPRDGRPLDASDLARVQARIKDGVRVHLGQCASRESLENFGCWVGRALMRPDESVKLDRIVHRALEEAFADAVRDREVDGLQDAEHLHHVLEGGLVRSVYQPVVDVTARRVLGFEALTRVASPRFQNVETLFKAAADHDALWTLERLCRRRHLEGLPAMGGEQLLFLNVEPEAIHDPELASPAFVEALRVSGLDPNRIVLELTEHSVVRDFAALHRTLRRFRALGFRLAMDDVGAGYSGLQTIAELSPDFIKLDRTLVREVNHSVIKRELISTIARFSGNTGIALVAEGVEERAELDELIRLGVRCAQGYLFARPGSPPAMPDWKTLTSAC
jgi:EAL domain-containing protein (putative c-di-GMP-specific phosphodiesterase class I)